MKSQELKLNLTANPPSLNPFHGIDLNCRSLEKAIFEGLTRIAPSGKPELALAASLSISPNKTSYTFTLRDSYFSNGSKITAKHFEQSWKRAIAQGASCLRADLFYAIKNAKLAKMGVVPLDQVGIKALDDKHLLVDLEHPTPYFLDLIANPVFAAIYDEKDKPEVFSGPFALKSWEQDRQIVLERNPWYWDRDSIQLERIVFSVIRDTSTALMMYEKGEFDWIGGIFTVLPIDALAKLEREGKLSSKPINGIYWLSLNTQSLPLNNAKIRKALSYALDREEIAKEILLGEIPTENLVAPKLLSKEVLPYPNGNLEEAKRLLALGLEELGLSKEELPPLALSHSDISGQKKLAESIAAQWEKSLGIKVDLSGCEWNIFFSNLVSRQYQIGGCIWFSLFNDAAYTLEFFRDPGSRYNAAAWQNGEYQKLLELADSAQESDERLEYLRSAEDILLDDMPVIPLFMANYRFLIRDNLKGLFFSDLGDVDFKWAYLETKTPKHFSAV